MGFCWFGPRSARNTQRKKISMPETGPALNRCAGSVGRTRDGQPGHGMHPPPVANLERKASGQGWRRGRQQPAIPARLLGLGSERPQAPWQTSRRIQENPSNPVIGALGLSCGLSCHWPSRLFSKPARNRRVCSLPADARRSRSRRRSTAVVMSGAGRACAREAPEAPSAAVPR